MPRTRRQPEPEKVTTRWTASQLVAFNLQRARWKAGMTQQEAAEAISRYTDSEWTQATVATAEGSVSGARIRQFNPSELLGFCFAFDVPIGWFFMPPTIDSDHAERLDMPNHPSGIGWEWVFGRTAPSEANVDDYLGHQDGWPERSRSRIAPANAAPFHAASGPGIALGSPMTEEELPYYYLLGMLRRGLGGSADLRRPTKESEADWFADAAAVLHRVSELFTAIGRRGPSPAHVMRERDLEDARAVVEDLERQRLKANRKRCQICNEPVELADPNDLESWVHAEDANDWADHGAEVDPVP